MCRLGRLIIFYQNEFLQNYQLDARKRFLLGQVIDE